MGLPIRRIAGLTLALALALTALAAQGAETSRLRYAGATTLKRDFMPKAAWAFEARTGIGFTIQGGNTDPGLQALLAGEADIAGAGRFLSQSEISAGLVETLVGWDPLVVVVHEKNPLEELSLPQLSAIFSGRIGRWSELGGPDQPILLVVSPEGSGMRTAVEEEILKGERVSPFPVSVALVEDGDQQVANLPIAITVLSRSMVDAPRVKMLRLDGKALTESTVALRQYPLVKPLLLVTNGEPRGELKAFIDFVLSPDGQVIMGRHFFGIASPSEGLRQP